MANTWIKLLAKAAGCSDATVYNVLKAGGAKHPYSEYQAWTELRARGRPCKNYRPVDDAVGKPVPPLGKLPKKGDWTEKLPINRLAKLLPGGATTNNQVRVRHWLKKAGITDFKTLDIAKALEILAARGIDVAKFAHDADSQVPKAPDAHGNGTSLVLLVEEPAHSRSQLLTQYTTLAERLRQLANDEIRKRDLIIDERDKKIAELVQKLRLVKQPLLQFENKILDVGKTSFGNLRPPLTWPIDALNLIRDL